MRKNVFVIPIEILVSLHMKCNVYLTLSKSILNICFCHLKTGIQSAGNSILSSCSQTEIVVIAVVLPMSKSDFTVQEDSYTQSVAVTANVMPEQIHILSIEEISVSSQRIAVRFLLSIYVRVQTSILLVKGQQSRISDRSILNANLNKNGLPSCTSFFVQNTTSTSTDSDQVSSSTPTPQILGSATVTPPPSGSESSAAASSIPLAAIVGCAAGAIAFLIGGFLVYRLGTQKKKQMVTGSTTSPDPVLCHLVCVCA